MRILIIRHGEPDYAHDCLTEKGWREAQYLAKRLAKEQIDWFYVSPMGRAQQTASCTLQAMNREAETLDWLREFQVPVIHTGDTVPTRPWDWIPSVWVKDERFFDKECWTQNPAFEQADLKEKYDHVIACFDALLEKHGYRRDGYLYDAVDSSHEMIALFCHFWAGVCSAQPFAECFTDGSVAWLLCCANECDGSMDGGTRTGNGIVPDQQVRGHFSFICAW